MIYSIQEIQQRIAPIAKQYGLKAVFLFGSYARGEAREDSDIDLLVDTSGTNLRSLLSLGALYCLFLAVTVYLFTKSNIILGKNQKSKGVFCSCNRRLTY